jgi:hypothetical protein
MTVHVPLSELHALIAEGRRTPGALQEALNWPKENAASVTGWRWESVDTRPAQKGRGAAFYTGGDRDTLGPAMGSWPRGPAWSAPATCWQGPADMWRHPGQDAPVADCECGYRVVKNLWTAHQYVCRNGGRPIAAVNPSGLVLVRVVTAGRWVANDGLWGMTPRNCVSAARIRPAWPAFVIDENVAAMMRDYYGTAEVYCLDDWDWKPLTEMWQRVEREGSDGSL